MIVNGKFVEYDLSRFKNCTIKPAALCDLMGIPEFVSAVNAYQGEINDEWVASRTKELAVQYKEKQFGSPRQRLLRERERRFRKMGLYDEQPIPQENRICCSKEICQ